MTHTLKTERVADSREPGTVAVDSRWACLGGVGHSRTVLFHSMLSSSSSPSSLKHNTLTRGRYRTYTTQSDVAAEVTMSVLWRKSWHKDTTMTWHQTWLVDNDDSKSDMISEVTQGHNDDNNIETGLMELDVPLERCRWNGVGGTVSV